MQGNSAIQFVLLHCIVSNLSTHRIGYGCGLRRGIFISRNTSGDRFWGQSSCFFDGHWSCLPRVKQPEHEVRHSCPVSASVKNKWSSAYLNAFRAWTENATLQRCSQVTEFNCWNRYECNDIAWKQFEWVIMYVGQRVELKTPNIFRPISYTGFLFSSYIQRKPFHSVV
jgi:hypothetical protein